MTHRLYIQTVGYLVGDKFEGSSFLFNAQVFVGLVITHLSQVPTPFWWIILVSAIAFSERTQADVRRVALDDVSGLLRDTYVPGDLGFLDPLGLKPSNPEAFFEI